MKFLYWEWHNGQLSKLHKGNPYSKAHTYCGALGAPNKAAGIEKVFRYKRPSKDPSDHDLYLETVLQPCLECFLLANPVVIKGVPPPVEKQKDPKRSEIALKAWADRKKLREAGAA